LQDVADTLKMARARPFRAAALAAKAAEASIWINKPLHGHPAHTCALSALSGALRRLGWSKIERHSAPRPQMPKQPARGSVSYK
jgi:hypothetical protein